jgi:hypothetical protein
MANPNIVAVTTIYGNTGVLAVTTAMANVVQNPSSSGTLYKINSLILGNACTAALSVTIQINQAGTNTSIMVGGSVPANASLVVLGKDTQIYLLENNSIQANTNANGYITAICSWEQIS